MSETKRKNWLPVASALSAFWKDGNGPDAVNTKEAIGAAGVEAGEIRAANKRELVSVAVKSSPLDAKEKVISELVDLLAMEAHFDRDKAWYQEDKVAKLTTTLREVGGSLLEDGTLIWSKDSDTAVESKGLSTPGPTKIATTASVGTEIVSPPQAEIIWGPSLETLLKVLAQVPAAALPLTGARRKNKVSVQVSDEYDVQDFIHMALKMLYKDVRAEESQASYAGVSPRVDFFIKQEKVVVEAKVARKGHANAKLTEELIIDAALYSKRPDVTDLICVVYDLDGSLKNPHGFVDDLEATPSKLRIHVVATTWPFIK